MMQQVKLAYIHDWKIADLADTNRSYLLLDDRDCILWISHKLRSDLHAKGIQFGGFLGQSFTGLISDLLPVFINERRISFHPSSLKSDFWLSGQKMFLLEMKSD